MTDRTPAAAGKGRDNFASDVQPASGLTRRQAVQTMTALAAAPTIALIPAVAEAHAPSRAAWDRALARYRSAEAESHRLWEIHAAAEEACQAECPRVARYFDYYDLHRGMDRETVARIVSYKVAERVGYSGLIVYPPDAAAECEAKVQRMKEESERVADEFMAYQQKNRDVRQRHRVAELDQQASDYRDNVYVPARDALMATPAPDRAALMLKFEIAATWVDDPLVDQAFADAKRLLAN